MTRLRLLNVKYSPNVGDGVIAECLEAELSRIRPGWDIASVDLAGRTGFSGEADRGRGAALSALSLFPKSIRDAALAQLIRLMIHRRYCVMWREALDGADAVLIGGGQLLSDAGQNFSQKIQHSLSVAGETGSRAVIFAVGVAHPWGAAGRRQFLSGFAAAPPAHVAVRDIQSQENWAKHIQGTDLPPATLCRDPGLLAAGTYGPVPREGRGDMPCVGIGVIHPNTIALHARGEAPTAQQAEAFWLQLASHLVGAGMRPLFFTNGASDDEQFLDRIHARARDALGDQISRADRPIVPGDLAAMIAGLDAVVAHRLHACIVAYAYRVPAVGLGWDAKLPAFFESVGREGFALPSDLANPAAAATAVSQALASPIDPGQHAAVIEETRAGIAACADAIDTILSSEIENPLRR